METKKIKLEPQDKARLEAKLHHYKQILHEFEELKKEYIQDPVPCRRQKLEEYAEEFAMFLIKRKIEGLEKQIGRLR